MAMRVRERLRDERGAVLALVAICMLALLGIAGLALDGGRGYLTKARLARAVDAGALSAARSLRQGQSVARARAVAVAAANGVRDGENGASLAIDFGTNAFGERTVRVRAVRTVPTLLIRVLGPDRMSVGSSAVAAVPPVDLVLVLDQSGSLERNHAWDDLQDAAKTFLDYFDDDIDQLGMTSFQLRGTHRFMLGHDFTAEIKSEIDAMRSAGDTNPGEGLQRAYEQITSAAVRERSAKVVVFFTDGRPTAFRGTIFGRDRALAVTTTGQNEVRGYFDNPDRLPTDRVASPDGCEGDPTCDGWTENEVRAQARQTGLDAANLIRSEGIYIYSITLGDPGASDPLEQPDPGYGEEIANVEGMTDPDQPAGKAYFAPSEDELRAVFDQVAQDLLVRLAQ